MKGAPVRLAMLTGWWWRQVGPGGQLALWLLVTLRVGLELVAVLSVQLQRPPGFQSWPHLRIQGDDPWSLLLSVWQRWDALWYQQIAEHGYRAGDNTVHFMPLYPLLVRIASVPLGGQVVLAQLVVSSVAFLAAMWLLYRVARLDVGPMAARLAVLLTALFPTGFYLLAPYTESLSLALSLTAFWLARRGRPWAAGLAGFGVGLARVPGVLLTLPLAFEYVRQRREAGKPLGWGLLAATSPALGLLATILYFRFVVGEPRSLVEVAALWGERTVPFWEALYKSWEHTTRHRDVAEGFGLLCALGFSLLAVAAARRLPPVYAVYVGLYVVMLLSRQTLVSPLGGLPRYVLLLFPCFVVLALWLARRPRLAAGWLLISTLLQGLLLQHWVRGGHV